MERSGDFVVFVPQPPSLDFTLSQIESSEPTAEEDVAVVGSHQYTEQPSLF
jgi:hypothetical protein